MGLPRVDGSSCQDSWRYGIDSSDTDTSQANLSQLERITQERTLFERSTGYESTADQFRSNDGAGGNFTSGNPDYPWDPAGIIYTGMLAAKGESGGYAGPDYPWNPGGIIYTASAEPVQINRNWQVDDDGMIANDPRIELYRVPELESGAFANPMGDIDKVVLHRTVTTSAESTFNSFETPRNGTHYGTHFVVGLDGTIYQTASLNSKTNHVANGHNSNSIGIEVVGMPVDADGTQTVGPPNGTPVTGWQALTPAQIAATAYLTNSLNSYYGFDSDTVAVHEDLQAKTEGEGRTVLDAIEDSLVD